MRCSRLLLLPLLSAPLLVQAAPVYTVAALGNLPGASYTQPLGINNSGQVVGRSNGAQSTAFLYSGGTMSSLGTFGGPNSEAGGINNAGVVAGSADLANGNSRAFTYAGGVKTALGTSGGSSSYGYGINNAGTVAGASYLAGDLTYHAVTYSGGAITDLGTLGGAASFGRVINDAGAVAGWSTNSSGDGRAFLAAGGVMTDPTAVPEPASFPAVLAALGLVGMMRRRKGRVRK